MTGQTTNFSNEEGSYSNVDGNSVIHPAGNGVGVHPAESRDEIRAAFFNAKPKSEIIEVFGQKVEIRQPPLEQTVHNAMTAQTMQSENPELFNDPAWRQVAMIIKLAYVPGTDILLFDDADVPVLMKVPFGDDIQRMQEAVTRVIGLDLAVEEARKNLSATQ